MQAKAPSMPRSAFLACMSSTTSLSLAKPLISSTDVALAPSMAKYLLRMAAL